MKQTAKTQTHSVCINCEYETHCLPLNHAKLNKYFCEEHEIKRVPIIAAAAPIAAGERTSRKQNDEEDDELQGLCRYCENRNHCIIAQRKCGVWSCSDYL
ncbi:MAG: hypothetical protein HQK50_00165 [Oligoflexia bacterium]|nr:hypothetical protein [Oligoflexia bacterium]MBF0363948.1 hypothetical protein [Oligoflexia bacterium]